MDPDLLLAMQLQQEFNEEIQESKSKPKAVKPLTPKNRIAKAKPRECLVDSDWELNDPNPDIHNLFRLFDTKYFWSSLGSVEVKWSPRMYTCAGICTYKGRGGCVVSLSLPLLKLRPRKDLVETLLHEMIHAYLFITKNNRDRSGHGPEFHKHMYRINAEAGTNITVYHSFHDEVHHYKTHWWRCNGPCNGRPPYFGLVKRAMNRAPGPNDFWYEEHQRSCGGEFIKIKEPDGFKAKKRKDENSTPKSAVKTMDLTQYLSKTSPEIPVKKMKVETNSGGFKTPNGIRSHAAKGKPTGGKATSSRGGKTPKTNTSSVSNQTGGSSGLSNVVGFKSLGASKTGQGGKGTGGVGMMSNRGGTMVLKPRGVQTMKDVEKEKDETRSGSSFEAFSGKGHKLGSGSKGVDRSKSRLLSLNDRSSGEGRSKEEAAKAYEEELETIDLDKWDDSDFDDSMVVESVVPVDNSKVAVESVCIDDSPPPETQRPSSSLSRNHANCPVCNKRFLYVEMNAHLDVCVGLESVLENSQVIEDSGDENDTEEEGIQCPICNFKCSPLEINQHLDECLQ